MSINGYKKLKNATGIYKHEVTKSYMARKKINGKMIQKTFVSLFEAKEWHNKFDGSNLKDDVSHYSSLRSVWETMQKVHFPTLATSTKSIWIRRYGPWKTIEHLAMDKITPSRITTWVNHLVEHYSSDFYQNSGRGRAGRCNLNNELNIFVTIFNWYKESEEFEREALHLTCPIKRKHKKLGFIKPVPDKKKQISLEHAFLFFEFLKPLYKDLAMMQFYTAGRVGEISGLQWSNIDLKNRRMLIKHTCIWDMSSKTFIELKPFPKNKEPRPCYITDEIMDILMRRQVFQIDGNDFVFHVEGSPINYCTVQLNYRGAQRKSGVPYSGTHILRHGMAKLARKVGGGLDAVIAMTGHKDLKLADHYSSCNEDDQKEVSEKIMKYVRGQQVTSHQAENVISIFGRKDGTN
jgi:integrase